MFEEAFAYAAGLHRAQTRKGTRVPYVAHLLGVAALVLEDGGDDEEAIAALLHDAAEDHGGRARLDDIRTRFGERVSRIVEGCSDSLAVPRPPFAERKRQYLERVRTEAGDVIRVSLADKVYNARVILAELRFYGDALWERFDPGRDEQLWYYEELARVFRDVGSGPMVAELEHLVEHLQRLVRAE